MEGNNMTHVEGPPWKTTARYNTFEEADTKRKELLEEEDLQVKVHWLRSALHKVFAVKTRLDPTKTPPPRKTKKKKRRKQ
jgi:hypothetical protein|tara:strand:- start:96 stop:335 length:240 start_codon:yes stop_codon:yes gene_type:complete